MKMSVKTERNEMEEKEQAMGAPGVAQMHSEQQETRLYRARLMILVRKVLHHND